MTIQIPDDVALGLANIAAVQRKTVEQVAVENLRLLFGQVDSPEAILRAVRGLPHPSAAAVDDMDAAIRAAHLPVSDAGPFDELPPA